MSAQIEPLQQKPLSAMADAIASMRWCEGEAREEMLRIALRSCGDACEAMLEMRPRFVQAMGSQLRQIIDFGWARPEDIRACLSEIRSRSEECAALVSELAPVVGIALD